MTAIEAYAVRKAIDNGIPFDLVNVAPGDTEAEVDGKIERLSAALRERELRIINEMLANSFKPGMSPTGAGYL